MRAQAHLLIPVSSYDLSRSAIKALPAWPSGPVPNKPSRFRGRKATMKKKKPSGNSEPVWPSGKALGW